MSCYLEVVCFIFGFIPFCYACMCVFVHACACGYVFVCACVSCPVCDPSPSPDIFVVVLQSRLEQLRHVLKGGSTVTAPPHHDTLPPPQGPPIQPTRWGLDLRFNGSYPSPPPLLARWGQGWGWGWG